MNEFERTIDYKKMESTNGAWNRLCLNSKWSVGCVSELIQHKKWSSKEEWEEFYYQSGRERLKLLAGNASILENFRMSYIQHNKQPEDLKRINYYHGRTQACLMERAEVLYDAVKDNGYHLSLLDCYECVRFRTICQTWNGIVVAESKCIDILSKKCPDLSFIKSEGETDYDYEIDYEVYQDNTLKAGIQIKPSSYFWHSSYLYEARSINAIKFKAYKEAKGVDVIIVVYDKNNINYITNLSEVLNKLSI